MDTLTKLNENFLSCNICTEIFRDPCTIGCYHTFCRECLTKYTRTRSEAIAAKSILCPNCRQMTKVPQPQEPVEQWCNQFKPSFLIQGLVETFTSREISDPLQQYCFTCQQIGKPTQAKSVCQDCDIMFCDACAKMHLAIPIVKYHVILPLGAGSNPQLENRKVTCMEHNCLVEFCCKDCQKAVCNKCCIVYHRKCNSVVTLDSMCLEMNLQHNHEDINSYLRLTKNSLEERKSEVEVTIQQKSSLKSEVSRVSQQAVDLIRRKETKLLDDLDALPANPTGEVSSRIKSGEVDLQTYQQYTDFIKKVMLSDSPMYLYDTYPLCQSGEITAEILKYENRGDRKKKVELERQFQIDRTLHFGHSKLLENKSDLQDIKLLATVSIKSKNDKELSDPCDIEVLNISGTETLVISDYKNSSVKSCYTKDGKPHCKSIQFKEGPFALTKLSQDRVAVSHLTHNRIKLIKLTPDPVLMSSIKTKKKYTCLTALSDTTLAAGCREPPGIDVMDLSGRVLRSVITPSNDLQLIQRPWYMCTTRQGHIVVADGGSGSVYCVTQQGKVLYTYEVSGRYGERGVTSTDTGSVIVVDYWDKKIVQLTETGEYVRDLLTRRDGVVRPQGIRVHGNKLYVTELESEHVKIYQL